MFEICQIKGSSKSDSEKEIQENSSTKPCILPYLRQKHIRLKFGSPEDIIYCELFPMSDPQSNRPDLLRLAQREAAESVKDPSTPFLPLNACGRNELDITLRIDNYLNDAQGTVWRLLFWNKYNSMKELYVKGMSPSGHTKNKKRRHD